MRRKFIEYAEEAPELMATAIDGMGVHDRWINVAAEHTSGPGQIVCSRTSSCWAEFKNTIPVTELEKARLRPSF